MKQLSIYVDASVIGGCEDPEFSESSLALWDQFIRGHCVMILSVHTLREIDGAPEAVKARLPAIPESNQVLVEDTREAFDLAQAYLDRGVVGPGSRADALHVALATVCHADVLVSWNFKHIVNLGRIHRFNSVNIEWGYSPMEIRTPREVLRHEEDL
jgi:hypothetical protein